MQSHRFNASRGWPRHTITLYQKVSTESIVDKDFTQKDRILSDRAVTAFKDHGLFQHSIRKQISERFAKHHVPLVIFGAGNHTKYLLNHTGIGAANVLAISDNNSERWGKRFFGYTVIPPSEIAQSGAQAVIVSSRAFPDEIYAGFNYL